MASRPSGRQFPAERCQSGRMGLTRNQVCPCGHPGFESLPLRQTHFLNHCFYCLFKDFITILVSYVVTLATDTPRHWLHAPGIRVYLPSAGRVWQASCVSVRTSLRTGRPSRTYRYFSQLRGEWKRRRPLPRRIPSPARPRSVLLDAVGTALAVAGGCRAVEAARDALPHPVHVAFVMVAHGRLEAPMDRIGCLLATGFWPERCVAGTARLDFAGSEPAGGMGGLLPHCRRIAALPWRAGSRAVAPW